MAGRIITADKEVQAIAKAAKRIAVLGIKTEKQASEPAFSVPRYLAGQGIEIIPVPVYYPDVTEILGKKVYRRVSDVPGHLDMVDVFRRSQDLLPHLEDLLAAHPDCVWLQLGIADDAFAEKLAAAGIDVVQDRCLLVEHRRAMLGS